MTPTVPLAILAIETGIDIDHLLRHFANEVTRDDVGMRCIPTDVARQFLADREDARQAKAERIAAEREAARRTTHPDRERVKALARSQRARGIVGEHPLIVVTGGRK